MSPSSRSSSSRARPAAKLPAPELPALDLPALNLVVLCGTASSAAVVRTLPSGRRLVTLSLRVPGREGKATSVPVTAWDPAAWIGGIGAGEALVVVGVLRRRFFRDGRGATASRVEVEAATIGRGGERRRRATAARRASRALDALE
jgi:hypothetical protein